MSQEIEAAAGDALGGFWRRGRHKPEEALPIGTPCPNCETPLQGPWCYHCGQLGEDYHRSTLKLIVEVFEGLLHFDGRVWKTLPDLFRHPARLTNAYLEGHRAPQVPPFRLFLVVLVLFFFAGSIGNHDSLMSSTTVTTDDHGKVLSVKQTTLETMSAQDRAKLKDEIAKSDDVLANKPGHTVTNWVMSRFAKVLDDPVRFKLVLEQWSERFAFLMLPLSAGLLSLLFMFQRRFYVFDHTIFSLHSLSANGLILAVVTLLSGVTAHASNVLVLAMPVHLFFHMRGVYQTSIAGTLLRMALLFIGSLVGIGFIFLGLFVVGLNGMGA